MARTEQTALVISSKQHVKKGFLYDHIDSETCLTNKNGPISHYTIYLQNVQPIILTHKKYLEMYRTDVI